MRQISVCEAREIFYSTDAKYVSQEQAAIYYDNFSGEIAIDTYVTCGCLVVKSNSWWHIHAIGAESDISSAVKKVKEFMDLNTEKLMVLTWDSIPDELTDKRGAYKFVRGYLPYTDPSVRELTINDYEQVKKCCSYDAMDNRIGNDCANEFLTYYHEFINDVNVINLGLFIGDDLVGYVQSFLQKGVDMSTVNIYVNRTQRQKGYAKRLLSAVCATSENVMYCYSCVKDNIASINTAKSCGFQFKGAYLAV
ncbi:MAG: GNAT family N-acetyltransferase [Clostridia bacterium]|nr:GNAT family N-acetyltransferase [Clostridia bacterium]